MDEGKPATALRSAGGSKLAQLIARRLALVALLFVVLEVVLVVVMYVHDEQTLIEDLIAVETDRVRGALRLENGRLQVGAIQKSGSTLAVAVFDSSGHRVFEDNPGHLPLPSRITVPDLQAETAQEQRGDSFFVNGVRRGEIDGKHYWIAVAISGTGFAPLLPALGYELLQHVALPLIPLSILLLVFNLAVVKRMLVPLDAAVSEVNALDPGQIGKRLHLPETPDEVRTLLGAVNRALDRMEHAIRLLRQFTADAAHELRTPLAVMTLSIEQLPAGEARSKLQEDTAGMTRLVNQMLDLARADGLDADPRAQTVLDDLVSSVVGQLLPLALSSGRSMSYSADGNPVVKGQPDLLERVLRNILQNALAHTPAGSVVEVQLGPGPQVSVRDHGPGIEDADRAAVFQRFWRKDRNRSHGAGLGLAIAQGIMESVGGSIQIEDAPGGGALLRLQFVAA